MTAKNYSPFVNNLVLIVGIACILYYLMCGMFVRFGQSMLWVWPVAGCVLIARYFLARAGIIAMLPKGLLITARTLIALCAAFFIAVECFVISGMVSAAPQGLDYLIILGARVNGTQPSLSLQTRVNVAARYLHENPDTLVIASGGQGEDEIISEAECIIRLLREAGIAEERIIREDQSTSTAENIRFSYALMDDPHAAVGVVTNGYHMFRAKLIARSHGEHPVSGVSGGSSLFMLPHNMTREFMTLVVGALRGDYRLDLFTFR